MPESRLEIGQKIASRILEKKEELINYWNASHPVKHFYVDQLLDDADVKEIFEKFPSREQLHELKSLRENKNVGIDIEKYAPIISNHLMAFQEPCVIDAVFQITGIKDMEADPSLYASGLSRMEKNQFLRPHLDNSSDGHAEKYRVINLLFYVSPDWKLENGGNLELWDEKGKTSTTVVSAFNRLAVMATDDKSWHSVSQVKADAARCCLSNYYFSPHPNGGKPYFHATTFRGRPSEKLIDAILRWDGRLRNGIRKVYKKGIFKTKHQRRK